MVERTKSKRLLREEAIQMAMNGRWMEAVDANKAILELDPQDVDAWNRLGKACSELGRYDESRGAYQKALELDPVNSIAKKNLERLAELASKGVPVGAPSYPGHRAALNIFIEEPGKSTTTLLQEVAPREALAKIAEGDEVVLKVMEGRKLAVVDAQDEYLGRVEPKLALRIVGLMEQGNRYAAAVTSFEANGLKIIIREVYQAASMAGRPSFPTRVETSYRSYIKGGLLRTAQEPELFADFEEAQEWGEEDEEAVIKEGFTIEKPAAAVGQGDEEEVDEEGDSELAL